MKYNKKEAFELRKNGYSYNNISIKLNIPKSTLSQWFSKEKWSNDIKDLLSDKARISSREHMNILNSKRRLKLDLLYKKSDEEALAFFDKHKENTLFIAGIVIYWGEGDKRSKHKVYVSNSDFRILKIFVDFLLKICKIDESRLKAWILSYEDLDSEKLLEFWSNKLKLNKEKFNKTIVIKGREKRKTLNKGVCSVGISNTALKRKMLIWIDRVYKEF